MHIPWPTDWSVLPERMRRDVHDGLLAHDVGLGSALWVLAPLGVAIALLAPVVAPPRRAAADLEPVAD